MSLVDKLCSPRKALDVFNIVVKSPGRAMSKTKHILTRTKNVVKTHCITLGLILPSLGLIYLKKAEEIHSSLVSPCYKSQGPLLLVQTLVLIFVNC